MDKSFFAWGSGRVEHWSLDGVDPEVDLAEQLDELIEDLAQVIYGDVVNGEVVLDVGWYPEFSVDGGFLILVVVDLDWDSPAFSWRGTTIAALRDGVDQAVAFIGRHLL